MRIFLAGHRGMVGRAILRKLALSGGHDVITATHARLDLTDQRAVHAFVQAERPDAVIVAAAKVGGIMANSTQPASFIHDNLMIATNLIQAAHRADVQQILQLGSSCIYPRDVPQPMAEDALLTGPLEPSNAPYAIAKIAAIKLCESYNQQYGRDYRSLMPTNLYGPHDNFHPNHAHVLPALMQRFHQATVEGADHVTLWGTGTPKREFLHVDDLADAALFVMGLPQDAYAAATQPFQSHINVGTGRDIAIAALAGMIAQTVGFRGTLATDPSKPDGTPRKLLDVGLLTSLGWEAGIGLRTGLEDTYAWFRNQLEAGAHLRAS
jgi:nucleoside-diphosphate-sugar epimerase